METVDARLELDGPEGEVRFYAMNFPVLPIGSVVRIYLEQGHSGFADCLESYKISTYEADSQDGICVSLEDTDQTQMRQVWKRWKDCFQENGKGVWVWPDTLDFSTRFKK